jgi:hypothetical protein
MSVHDNNQTVLLSLSLCVCVCVHAHAKESLIPIGIQRAIDDT